MKNRAGIRGLFKEWGHGRAGNLPGDCNPAGLKACQQFGRGASPLKKKRFFLKKTKLDKTFQTEILTTLLGIIF